MRFLRVYLFVALAALLIFGAGCVMSPKQKQSVSDARAAIQQARVQAQLLVTAGEVSVATLPPGDPVRVAAERNLPTLQKYLAMIDAYLGAADAGLAVLAPPSPATQPTTRPAE